MRVAEVTTVKGCDKQINLSCVNHIKVDRPSNLIDINCFHKGKKT